MNTELIHYVVYPYFFLLTRPYSPYWDLIVNSLVIKLFTIKFSIPWYNMIWKLNHYGCWQPVLFNHCWAVLKPYFLWISTYSFATESPLQSRIDLAHADKAKLAMMMIAIVVTVFMIHPFLKLVEFTSLNILAF